MKPVTAVLIGAGGRGMDSYAPYAQQHPDELKFVAVAEPDDGRRAKFKALYNIPDHACFRYDHELLEQPQLADAALICTQDRQHFEPAMKALARGYHILLEKPMAPAPQECIKIGEAVERHRRVCVVCHVLRYTAFFRTLRRLIADGRLGRLISIQHNENVAYWHQALSYVRGPWSNTAESSPMILAKSCHDMDLLLWLADSDCVNLSSFGSLAHFRPENAPAGSPDYCQDGCPVEDECPWYAPGYYLHSEFGDWAIGVENDADAETKLKALRNSKHGRCVYKCNNDVVDHQVVSLEFASQATAVFTMCAFTQHCSRTIKLMGTRAEIGGSTYGNVIEVKDFQSGAREVIDLSAEITLNRYGHGGGDYRIMHEFVKLVRDEAADQTQTSAAISVQGHLMAFAAEESRLERRTIRMAEYVAGLQQT